MRITHHDGAIQGARPEQQDSLYSQFLPNGLWLLVVADGTGGEGLGQVASRTVCDGLRHYFAERAASSAPQEDLYRALLAANDKIRSEITLNPSLAGMASTVVAVLLNPENGRFSFISVGDSPLYCYRGATLFRINENHVIAEDLKKRVVEGALTPTEARRHPARDVVKSSLTGQEIKIVDQKDGVLLPGELLILGTDGLLTLDDAADGPLARLVQESSGNIEKTVYKILGAVNAAANPNQDNASLMIVGLSEDSSASLAEEGERYGNLTTGIISPVVLKSSPKKLGALVGAILLALLLGIGLFWLWGEDPIPSSPSGPPANTGRPTPDVLPTEPAIVAPPTGETLNGPPPPPVARPNDSSPPPDALPSDPPPVASPNYPPLPNALPNDPPPVAIPNDPPPVARPSDSSPPPDALPSDPPPVASPNYPPPPDAIPNERWRANDAPLETMSPETGANQGVQPQADAEELHLVPVVPGAEEDASPQSGAEAISPEGQTETPSREWRWPRPETSSPETGADAFPPSGNEGESGGEPPSSEDGEKSQENMESQEESSWEGSLIFPLGTLRPGV
ncbi:MAG: protein phosphatase 2C domain-containing protein [Deltaproteobacteria bacterium]|jgi:serine/threonine protein phosphatase PrpC|nr:protein phosphatase 2C domain-containing protein [Deltaproteobacteria bacterium]